MKAVKCPVCDGSGKYNEKKCHGCDGKGWVEVNEGYFPYPSVSPYPYPWEPYSTEFWTSEPWYKYPYTITYH